MSANNVNNSKPKNAAPVIVVREEHSDMRRYFLLFMPAALASIVFHAVLLFVFFLLSPSSQGEEKGGPPEESIVNADQPVDEKKEPFQTVDVDPAAQEVDTDINYMVDRIAEVSVPGSVNPNEAVGIMDGPRDTPPVSLPAPGGFGSRGQGGALERDFKIGNSTAGGEQGGYGPKGLPLQGTFYGRSGATKEFALRDGGGTGASEAAVARGLKWLVRQQMPDGKWMLNGPTLPERDRGTESNDIAGTALGLLPLLAAGKTHKAAKDNPYDKNIDKALKFLMRSQDKKTGFFGVTMYAHGLATITMCEAYGLSQDPSLRRSAQAGVNLIVNKQHEGGGWRYTPEKQPGDLSVSGWQIMAMKSGQMAGLDVPTSAVKKAVAYLDSSCSEREGYGYTGPGDSARLTAVGLLCRQYMQNWGPSHPRMIKSINTFIKATPPDHPSAENDVYYYYYATQVMHHFSGEAWKQWNDKMRESLIKKQDQNQSSPNFGSWSPKGDAFGAVGGRLMMTSLNLLTLEVYYRYLPLYYRDAGYKADDAVKKAQ
jgi:hypothetical protein